MPTCSGGVSLTVLIIYIVFSFGGISFSETFSLWAYTQPDLGSKARRLATSFSKLYMLCLIGGLGFSLHEIGISLTVVGVLVLPVTLVMFPLVRAESACDCMSMCALCTLFS